MDDRTSHKQSFRALKAQLSEEGVNVEHLWGQLHEVLVEGVIAMHHSCTGHQGEEQPTLGSQYDRMLPAARV